MRRAACNRFHGGDDSTARDVALVLILRARLDRESLAALLRTRAGYRVVGEAADDRDILPLCARTRPAVAIIDTTFLWPAGSCRIAEVLAASPGTHVLALPPHDTPWCAVLNPPSNEGDLDGVGHAGVLDCLRLAVQEGAHGVLRRSCGALELFEAVETVARGRFWVGTDVSLRYGHDHGLSDRELAVAWLVGQGRSNKEISRTLMISELTVKKHVSHILEKLKLHDRLQLGLCVARHPSVFAAKGRSGISAED